MSLTERERVAELSPSRLAVVLFVDCFEQDAALRTSAAFWRAAATCAADADAENGLFDQLLRALPAAQLAPYVAPLAARLATTDSLETAVKGVWRRVQDGAAAVRPKSFVGCLCCDQAVLLDTLDIFGALAVWRNMLAVFVPFAESLDPHGPAQGLRAAEPAGLAGAGHQLLALEDPMRCLEHRDVEATLASFYRSLDLQGGQFRGQYSAGGHLSDGRLSGGRLGQLGGPNAGAPAAAAGPASMASAGGLGVAGGAAAGVAPSRDARDSYNQRAKTQELAIIYESFGYVAAALEAQSHAFASERRRLAADEAGDEQPPGAPATAAPLAAETWGMVSWLHRVLAFNDPVARVPPQLDLPLSTILDYLRKSAQTADEHAVVASIDMNEALDAATSQDFLLSTARTMLDLYASHWQAPNPAVKNCTFHLLLSVMWFRFGKKHAASSHTAQGLTEARACTVPSLKSHLLSELAFSIGFEHGDLAGAVLALEDAASAQRFDELSQHVRSLLFAALAIRAHNFEAAEHLLEELDGTPLNKFERRTCKVLRVELLIFRGQNYPAYVLAGQCVADMPKREQLGYWAVHFRLAGARALVLSQDPLNAIEARCWISECLRAARQLGLANLMLEAALLEARLFLYEGDYHSCRVLCHAVEQDAATTPNPWLDCEWQLLNAASTQLLTGELTELRPDPFKRALYTEFGSNVMSPHLTAVCLRPHVVVERHDTDAHIENPISAASNNMLSGQLKHEDFRAAIETAYTTLVDWQNRSRQHKETPVAHASTTNVCLERLSYVQGPPPLEEAFTPPPPDIHVSRAAESPSQTDEGISLPKRLRPASASPRKERKRRSYKLEPTTPG